MFSLVLVKVREEERRIGVVGEGERIRRGVQLNLLKQNLLDEQQDRVMMAEERMKKAEVHAQECRIELGGIRVQNLELDRKNVSA